MKDMGDSVSGAAAAALQAAQASARPALIATPVVWPSRQQVERAALAAVKITAAWNYNETFVVALLAYSQSTMICGAQPAV